VTTGLRLQADDSVALAAVIRLSVGLANRLMRHGRTHGYQGNA
jgi:hypothetical protein